MNNPRPPADSHDLIHVRGARENNLQNVSLDIPTSGKTVVVIEHHQAVMAHANWIIDIGPGAGHDGGRIVFEGTPADIVADASTLTGQHLRTHVGA